MENNSQSSVLPAAFKKVTLLLWVFILPQGVLLALNCFSFWIIRDEILPQNLMAAAVLLGSAVFMITFYGGLLFFWVRRGLRDVPWTWNWFFLLAHIAYLWFATSEIPHIIPGAVESWVLDLGQVILHQYTFMMPGLFYAAMRLACFETRLSRGSDIGRSLLVAVVAPALWYTAMLGFSAFVHRSWDWIPPVAGIVFFVGTTLLTLVALIRLSVLFYGWYQSRDPWIHNIVIALVAVGGPLAGLLLNYNIPFPADFQMKGIYVLAVFNGLVLLVPSVLGIRGKGWLLFLRALTYPFTVYFFLVFLPFLPLSLLAICALGLGFLFLIPPVLFLIHTRILIEDGQVWSLQGGRAQAAALVFLACLVLPGYFTLEAVQDKTAIQQALDYVYSADYEQPQRFQGSLPAVKKVLVKMKRSKSGVRLPYLSAFYNQLVFNGMILPDSKIEYMYRLFTGEAVPEAKATSFYGRRGRTRSSRGTEQRLRAQRNREVIVSSFERSSEDKDFTTVTRLRLYLRNTGKDDAAEFFQECEVPSGVLISDFRLLVNKQLVRGQLFERDTATWVYHMIRDWTRRDPGLLVYTSPSRVEMSVFPFREKEVRIAELEFTYPRGMAPVIKIGPYRVFLQDSPVLNGMLPMALTGRDPGGEAYALILTRPAETLLLYRRRPYLHFIVDFSAGSMLSPEDILQSILNTAAAFPEADFIRISAANFEIEPLSPNPIPVREKAFIRAAIQQARLPRQGSLDLSRVMKHILSVYQSKLTASTRDSWQRYPVFVVITAQSAKLSEPEDMAFYQELVPEQERYYVLIPGQALQEHPLGFLSGRAPTQDVVVIKHGPHISWVPVFPDPQWHLAAKLGQDPYAPYEVYHPGEDKFFPVSSARVPSGSYYAQVQGLFVKNALMMRNPAWLERELPTIVRDSKSTGVMVPSTSYIVVERSSQWKTLSVKERQKMASAQGLEFEDDFDTPEPPVWLLGGLFVFWLGWRRDPGRAPLHPREIRSSPGD